MGGQLGKGKFEVSVTLVQFIRSRNFAFPPGYIVQKLFVLDGTVRLNRLA